MNITAISCFSLRTATETWCLGRYLPVMIGHQIPCDDPYWAHYLQLLDILDILCAPVIHRNTPAYLQVLLESNLITFRELYPQAKIIPKIHYLLHMPRYIQK